MGNGTVARVDPVEPVDPDEPVGTVLGGTVAAVGVVLSPDVVVEDLSETDGCEEPEIAVPGEPQPAASATHTNKARAVPRAGGQRVTGLAIS